MTGAPGPAGARAPKSDNRRPRPRRPLTPAVRALRPQPELKTAMTDDLTRQNELKKMTLCEACAGIQRNWRKAPGHPELMQGKNRTEAHKHGQVTITRYCCERCGTNWEYENNKVDRHAGWSVVGG